MVPFDGITANIGHAPAVVGEADGETGGDGGGARGGRDGDGDVGQIRRSGCDGRIRSWSGLGDGIVTVDGDVEPG